MRIRVGDAVLASAAVGLGLATAARLHEPLRRHLRRHIQRLIGAQTPPPDERLMRSVEACVFDCDGVIYHNGVILPGVADAIGALQRAGKRCLFCTNAAGLSRKSLAAKLTKLGIPGVTADHCVTSAYAAAAYLAAAHPECRRAYVVGGGGLLEEMTAAGIDPVGEADIGGLTDLIASGGLNDDVDAVVVGMLSEGLCYARLAKAAAYARDRRRPFVGTNPDQSFPGGCSELIPAGGCVVQFVACGAERQPDVVVGKPSRDLARLVAELFTLRAETTLMVGDRTNTDIAFGRLKNTIICLT